MSGPLRAIEAGRFCFLFVFFGSLAERLQQAVLLYIIAKARGSHLKIPHKSTVSIRHNHRPPLVKTAHTPNIPVHRGARRLSFASIQNPLARQR